MYFDYRNAKDDKTVLDLSRLIYLVGNKENFKLGKIIDEPGDKNRRIGNKCEIKLNIHKFVCEKESGNFSLFNRNQFKSIVTKNIEKMIKEEEVLRSVLLGLNDGAIVWVLVNRDYDTAQRDIALQELKVQDLDKYEDLLYYRIYVEAVFYEQPAEPKSLTEFPKYIETFNNEVRYLINKKLFTKADSWFNSIYNKYFKMSNSLKKQLTPELENKLLPMFKSLFLNKTLILKSIDRPDKKFKDYEDIITYIAEYKKCYKEKDEKYFKIVCREADAFIEVRNLEKARAAVAELIEMDKDHPEIKRLSNRLDSKKPKPVPKSLIYGFGRLSENEDNQYVWEKPRKTIDLSSKLFPGIINNC
jgi:tetratricopeptide (TPR) repeat protein